MFKLLYILICILIGIFLHTFGNFYLCIFFMTGQSFSTIVLNDFFSFFWHAYVSHFFLLIYLTFSNNLTLDVGENDF